MIQITTTILNGKFYLQVRWVPYDFPLAGLLAKLRTPPDVGLRKMIDDYTDSLNRYLVRCGLFAK